jgi:hypothetical protein
MESRSRGVLVARFKSGDDGFLWSGALWWARREMRLQLARRGPAQYSG